MILKKRRLIWHIYPYYLLIILACISAFGIYFMSSLKQFHYRQIENELRISATLLAKQIATNNTISTIEKCNICKEYATTSGYRFTVILPSGKVVSDSQKDIKLMDNHSNRPEIKEAQKNGFGSNRRYSQTLRMDMLYVAVPITVKNKNIGTVRAAIPLNKINIAIQKMWYRLTIVAIIIAILAIVATIIATRRITSQLSNISTMAKDFGDGNLHNRLPSSSITEIDMLATNMNSMSQQLEKRINTIVKQRDEQNVLWACMAESVIAVDNNKNILRINHAAEELFTINSEKARGKNIVEFIRYADLLNIIDTTLESTELIEESVFLADHNKYLQAHGSIIHDNNNNRIGALIVLNNITKLRKLEAMRKDFVANVSHELKTPITSIKGFIDTLIDAEVKEKEDQDRFMQIIRTQANNLQAIVDDLLTLSSIEHELEGNDITLENIKTTLLLESAIQTCATLAEQKNITLKLTTDTNITAKINPQLLEQAVINLINNAIKYSDTDTEINIKSIIQDQNLIIEVIDQGIGIADKYQSRVFQRFYRVDKSRSRKSGGTGLGLAIVKHSALAHNGHVKVTSKLGKGSTFSIIIPVGV